MSVPLMDFKQPRNDLKKWSQAQGEQSIKRYWKTRNQTSLDNTNIVKLNSLD